MSNFLNIALKDRRKARIYTAIIMLLFFLVLIFAPLFSYQNPPPGQQGLLVSFGEVNTGGQEAPPEPSASKSETEEEKPEKPTKPKTKPKPKPEKTKPKPKPVEKPKVAESKVDEKVISARNEEIALQKKKAKEEKTREENKQKAKADALAKAESDRLEKERAKIAEAESKRKAKEEAEALAAAESARKKKETEDFKNSLTKSLKSGNGTGRGDGPTPGSQGVPDGDPSADALKGLSTGIGKVGGGLGGRGGSGPGISDNSNKTGTVVVKVCIDSSGRVTSADYTLKGSSTSDPDLQKLAIENAKKWAFKSGIADTTCGTITYDFKVK